MKNEKNMDKKPMLLRWYDSHSQQFFSAGVAFYNAAYGDYSLKLNLGRGKVYLRPTAFDENYTHFKVEEVRQENERIIKNIVGWAYMDGSTNGRIHIKIGGYSDTLVLG